MHRLPWLVLLFACNPSETEKAPSADTAAETADSAETADTAGPTSWYPDLDADGHGGIGSEAVTAVAAPSGYAPVADDCDDSNATVNPDAPELCDEIDDDCDGEIDESDAVDATAWYSDDDHDGYGADDSARSSCTAIHGRVSTGGDCDDEDPMLSPDAIEVCDGIDNDCDGEIDGHYAGERDGSDWCLDEDGDGYGGESSLTRACDQPDGYTYCDDCDDTNPDYAPNGTELCENGIDENCDSVDSDCDWWGLHSMGEADAIFRWSDDLTGEAVAPAGDMDGDGYGDVWIGSSASSAGLYGGGAISLVRGPVSGDISLPDGAEATITGATERGQLGYAASGAFDYNDDGYPDLWVGEWTDSTLLYRAGAASLFLGPVSGALTSSDANLRWLGASAEEVAGTCVGAGGDLNGDGLSDLVIGAPGRDAGAGSWSGAAYVVTQDGEWGQRSLETAAVEIDGSDSQDFFGIQVAIVGDTDGDGLDDAAFGADSADLRARESGGVYLLTDLPADGAYDVSDITTALKGEARNDAAGDQVAAVGDMNGDGYADFGVGAAGDATTAEIAGAIYLVYGPVGERTSLSDADAKLVGVGAKYYTRELGGGGDIDGDGNLDLIVGACRYNIGRGEAYLLHGPIPDGTTALADADARYIGERDGGVAGGDYAGWSVALVGDTNADGYGDLMIGAPATEILGEDGTGSAYLFLGAAF